MNDLLNKKCAPCEGGVIPFDVSEIHKYQKKVDGWDVLKDKKKNFFLNKKFNFKNFFESQEFVNKVGIISETEGHHPDIIFGWGYAEIKISTHAIEELKKNKGSTTLKFREKLSRIAFSETAYYDSVISNYFNNISNISWYFN